MSTVFNLLNNSIVVCISLLAFTQTSLSQEDSKAQQKTASVLAGKFHWNLGSPILDVEPKRLPESKHPWIAIKDPSIVRHEGRWHLFCTLRKKKKGDGRIRIGHLAFDEWAKAGEADWSVLDLTDGYHGAPQIFFFEPHKKWYLIYQAEDQKRDLKYGPCYSTNDDINDPKGWTLPQPLYTVKEGAKAGLDFWLICDTKKAHLFFTSLNGKMWRAESSLDSFPNGGWTDPKVVLKGDIFEASHNYKLKGLDNYLTFVEAKLKNRRYFKAYLADDLAGDWIPIADRLEHPFASPSNVNVEANDWTVSYSHGELVRLGVNQNLEVDPANLRLLFQGANATDVNGADYGDISWRLGFLEHVLPPKTR